MKILNASLFKTPGINFKRIVDYGSKENDLIYVPILFEEQDTFQPSTNEENQSFQDSQYKPKKLGNLLTTGGGIIAAVEVIPDTIDKLVNKSANVAKNSLEQINSVKDAYKQTFHKSEDKTDMEETLSEHQDEYDNYDPYDNLHHSNDEHDLINNHHDVDENFMTAEDDEDDEVDDAFDY